MSSASEGLLANLAVVGIVMALWANLYDAAAARGRRFEAVAFGLAMSGGTLIAMIMPFRVAAGVIVDLREAPLSLAGFFGGPLAALIAAGPALLYRACLGGDGALAGCLDIVLVTGFAVLHRRCLGPRAPRARDIVVLAVVAALFGALCFLALPVPLIAPTMTRVAAPGALLDVIGIILSGLSMLGEQRRRELIRTNALYRAVIEALPDCLNVKDAAGRFLAANPATARLMGAASPDALIGRTDFDFYPPATAQRFRNDELAMASSEQQGAIEQRAEFADGRTLWLSTLKVPFRDPRGEIVGLITHNRDVTATKLIALELHQVRQQLADALANMADGLVLYDSHARIVLCNAQYRALFPLTADRRVAGTPLADILRASVTRGEETLPPGQSLDAWIATVLGRLKDGGDRLIALADGRWLEVRTRPVADGGSLSVFSDVTLRQQQEKALRHRAEHDPLTGLANRAAFETRLTEAHRQARAQGTALQIVMIDLDRFKQVNDTFGHGVGDRLLIEVGRRLVDTCRHGDLVARLGGDEFAVICERDRSEAAACFAQRVLDRLTTPFQTDGITLLPGGSVGFTVFPADPGDPDALVAHADQALYAAKVSGRRCWVDYGAIGATGGVGRAAAHPVRAAG